MKKKKTLLFIFIPIAAIALIALIIAIIPKGAPKAIAVNSIVLEPTTLQSKISSTGVVDGSVSRNVYGTLPYPVQTIEVEVGDKVEAGAVLCQLDTKDLEYDIAKQQATINSANKAANHNIATGQENYNTAKANLDKGLNSTVINATSSLANAKIAMDNAYKDYQNAKGNLDSDKNAQILNAEAAVDSAKIRLDDATREYNAAKDALDDDYNINISAAQRALDAADEDYDKAKEEYEKVKGDDTPDEEEKKAAAKAAWESAKRARNNAEDALDDAEESAEDALESLKAGVDAAQISYDSAVALLDAAQTSAGQGLEQLQTAYNNAKTTYDTMMKAKQAADEAVKQELNTYQNNVESSKISADNSVNQTILEQLQQKLKDCTITAPVAGTVTAVYATEGNAPSGVMFIIENTDTLEIKARVKEYDIGSISENMKVLIESDATGDDEYEGYVSKIAPTAIKQSEDSGSSGTEFEIEVTVSSADTKLLIGMNTRLNIIAEQKENALGVGFDAVETDEEGNDSIYIAKDNGDGTYTAEKIPVTAGLESDFEIEVSGENITTGTIVITDLDKVKAGSIVRLSE